MTQFNLVSVGKRMFAVSATTLLVLSTLGGTALAGGKNSGGTVTPPTIVPGNTSTNSETEINNSAAPEANATNVANPVGTLQQIQVNNNGTRHNKYDGLFCDKDQLDLTATLGYGSASSEGFGSSAFNATAAVRYSTTVGDDAKTLQDLCVRAFTAKTVTEEEKTLQTQKNTVNNDDRIVRERTEYCRGQIAAGRRVFDVRLDGAAAPQCDLLLRTIVSQPQPAEPQPKPTPNNPPNGAPKTPF